MAEEPVRCSACAVETQPEGRRCKHHERPPISVRDRTTDASGSSAASARGRHEAFGSGETFAAGRSRSHPGWKPAKQFQTVIAAGLIMLVAIVAVSLVFRGSSASAGAAPVSSHPSMGKWSTNAQAACDVMSSALGSLPTSESPPMGEGEAEVRVKAYQSLASSMHELTLPAGDEERVEEWVASVDYLVRFH